jgi:hypothetical protein
LVLRFLINTFVTAVAVAFYLKWSDEQTEGQLDKMQRAVHGTPGATAPVPPEVMLGGAVLLAGHWLVSRLLGLNFVQAIVSLVGAIGAGFGYFFFGAGGRRV